MTDSEQLEADSSVCTMERKLVSRIVRGERNMFAEIVHEHANAVYSALYRFTGSDEHSRDLAQEAFLKAFLNLGQFRFQCSLRSWLLAIALNLARSDYRSRRRRDEQRTDELFEAQVADNSLEPERAVLMRQLHQAIRTLPSKDQEVIMLCGVEGLRYEEAAEALGVPVGTIRSRLNTARLRLKEELKRREAHR